MTVTNSSRGPAQPSAPNHVRHQLDEVDLLILRRLFMEARTPNNALADEVGVAASTCLGRVKVLRETGVIRGYHADIDPVALGRPIQAMIAVRLQAHARGSISDFVDNVAELPEVRNVFFVGGANDFLVHVAASSTDSLRNFVVVNLSGNTDVAMTETSLIFEHRRGLSGV